MYEATSIQRHKSSNNLLSQTMGYKNSRIAVDRMEHDANLLRKHHGNLAVRTDSPPSIPNNESTSTFLDPSNASLYHKHHGEEAEEDDIDSSILSQYIDPEEEDDNNHSSHVYNLNSMTTLSSPTFSKPWILRMTTDFLFQTMIMYLFRQWKAR
jgi:hypothetical protein